MGYLLKEALKTLCGVNRWSYAVFWKIGCHNPKLLIWEECYYEVTAYTGLHQLSAIEKQEGVGELSQCSSQLALQARTHYLVNKMMIDNNVNIVGEGLIGRAAFNGKHAWILSENCSRETHPPEVLNEVLRQFVAGMQTIAVIPILPHGVVQFGSSLTIMENMAFVNDVKSLFLQLGCVPGVLLSADCATKHSGPTNGIPIHVEKSVSTELMTCAPSMSNSCNRLINSTWSFATTGPISSPLFGEGADSHQFTGSTSKAFSIAPSADKSFNDHCEAKVSQTTEQNFLSAGQLAGGETKAKLMHENSEEWQNELAWFNILVSRLTQQLGVSQSTTNNGNLTFLQKQLLSDIDIRNHNDIGSATSVAMTSQRRADADILPIFLKDSVSAPLIENLFDVEKPKGGDSLCPLLSGTDLQEVVPSNSKGSTSSFGFTHHNANEKSSQFGLSDSKVKVENDLFQALGIPLSQSDNSVNLSDCNSGFTDVLERHGCVIQSLNERTAKYEDLCVQRSSGDDLFDVVGADFKNKLFSRCCTNFLSSGLMRKGIQNLDKCNMTTLKVEQGISDFYPVNSEGGVSTMSTGDHLLDAVISRGPPDKHVFDDNLSCRTALTDTSISVPNVSHPNGQVVSDQMQGELFSFPNFLLKAGEVRTTLFTSGPCKEMSRNCSQSGSEYGSQISSWVEQGHDVKQNSSVSTAYSKRPDEGVKSRKRLKPGENPRPRPKDRQMIQDRVKELREIVPNGAKCSIDALLERTIKHMLFLQSVTKHADKLKQTGESKIFGKECGLLLKDNFDGGATWAYEVGSQSMVCPIIVEDLTPPRQMLVEMLCDERGLFLEIADIIRGLGLTILKGVMETRDDKIWARFALEANKDVTRMEIFISLVQLLDPSVKTSTSMSLTNNIIAQAAQQFHQASSIPSTGRPCSSLQ